MEKQTRPVTFEHAMYFLAFGIALGLRLLRLGNGPLSDFEAGWAMQSLNAVRGEPFQIGANPAYFSLTTLVFFLFGDSNGLARLWPALVGSLIVFVPLGFRRWLGPVPGLIMAFGLALDPGMVALSRLAGGPMIAIASCAFLLVLLVSRKPVLAGVVGGFALVSGSSIFIGLTGLLLTFGLAKLAGFLPINNPESEPENSESPTQWTKEQIRTALFAGLMTSLLAATLFFRFPGGLGAFGNSLAQYFRGWFIPSGAPVMVPILAVVFYQPLALTAASITAIRGWRDGNKTVLLLSAWVLMGLALSLIYPGRQVYDVAWILLPLWTLAALEIRRYLKKPRFPKVAFSQSAIVFFLLVLFWLISLNFIPGGLAWMILASLPLLIMMTTILVGLGWSWDTTRCGFAWGLCLAYGLYSLAAMVGVSQLHPNSPRELWFPRPGAVQTGLLVETVKELAIIQNGRDDWIDIVSEVDRPSLQWALRDFSDVHYVSAIGPDVLASIILTPVDSSVNSTDPDISILSQSMAYRGQDFAWASMPGWPGALPSQWWKWVTIRQAPVLHESLILWARSDLFPGQLATGQDDPTFTPDEIQNGLPEGNSIE